MLAFVGKPTFFGEWNEDLHNCIKIFITLATMCEVDDANKLKIFPVILTGDERNYFENHAMGSDHLDDAMRTLRYCYNSDDKTNRVLTSCQKPTLSQAIAYEPNESEVTVFRKVVSKLISIQHQLDETYHLYSILRDRLLAVVNIPAIQVVLPARMPRNSQYSVNRVANQLGDEKTSAGINSSF